MNPIAVIDDSPTDLAHAVSELTQLGFECRPFNSGLEFLDAVDDGACFLAIFCDDGMPMFSGYQLCAQWVANDSDMFCPFILMISKMVSNYHDFARLSAANGAIKKPINHTSLAKTLQSIPRLSACAERVLIERCADKATGSGTLKRL